MEFLTPGHCISSIRPLRDALDVINGKWKLQILVVITTGHQRFREIERSIPSISSKVLAKELKDLEAHKLIKRTVQEGPPVLVTYEVLPYADSLDPVIFALRDWGLKHRAMIMGPDAGASPA
ncbi:transcriptional regulator [Hymenobacter sp. HMF4947]|uniref:Transcriptional regulator n=1 Tax=Hymenobacter ginkgonis TaxID=2682976 RepID=A0A7K1TKU6_9BACT|nr:helix-turn-helix domain-containing protein [Hymenobacter ginkgonis]MVN78721.1 transcriptional regulator [Hymenobacter ginkgonis]